jgi:phage N-6-adenine-methyltransferase
MRAAAKCPVDATFDEATAAAFNRELWGNNPHRTLGTGNNEWHTPQEYVEAARALLGTIDLDPASNADAQRTVKATTYFTIADNGLTKEWRGKVWLNPPHARSDIGDFVGKLVAEYQAGRVTEAILLTHANTDTEWFHAAVKAARVFCLTHGRIRFVAPDDSRGLASATPTQGQCFFYFGNRPDAFLARFTDIGFVTLGGAANIAHAIAFTTDNPVRVIDGREASLDLIAAEGTST